MALVAVWPVGLAGGAGLALVGWWRGVAGGLALGLASWLAGGAGGRWVWRGLFRKCPAKAIEGPPRHFRAFLLVW